MTFGEFTERVNVDVLLQVYHEGAFLQLIESTYPNFISSPQERKDFSLMSQHAHLHQNLEVIDEGQFDDAPDDTQSQVQHQPNPEESHPREGHNYIDEEQAHQEPEILQWSSDDLDDGNHEQEYDAFDEEQDDLESSAFLDSLRPEDEDWEIAEGGA